MSSQHGTPQAGPQALPQDPYPVTIANLLHASQRTRYDLFPRNDQDPNSLRIQGQPFYSTLPQGIPSPPDSNAPSNPAESHQDEYLLVPHYLSFTTPVEHYAVWSTRMTIALTAAGLLAHVSHGLQQVLPEAEFLVWVHRDEQAKRMIMSKLGDDALNKMLETRRKAREILMGTGKRESAFGLWVYLSRAYGGEGRTE